MTTPTIHLNGTSAKALQDGYEKANVALGEAMAAVVETAPNARDYYVQGPDAYRTAQAEHDARMAALITICTDMAALASAVYDQEQARWLGRRR